MCSDPCNDRARMCETARHSNTGYSRGSRWCRRRRPWDFRNRNKSGSAFAAIRCAEWSAWLSATDATGSVQVRLDPPHGKKRVRHANLRAIEEDEQEDESEYESERRREHADRIPAAADNQKRTSDRKFSSD